MQKGHFLHFNCPSCKTPLHFSIFELDRQQDLISCSQCKKKYFFGEENLKRQLRKFELLCRQIADSEEILGNTAVGIDFEGRHIKIPYKLLLTRLSSTLSLEIGDQTLSIEFRIEPIQDLPSLK